MAASQSGQPPPHKRTRVRAERDNVVSSPQKRSRIHPERDNDDFMRGNIIKIRLHNFMTYSDITTNPGPRLNLVIGPNGTGKSSLVCAIAIGLGGEPQLLGRAGHIGDYVKRGEESGTVEISLRGDSSDETIVITRKINKQNKSDWLLNGRPASKRTVQETVQRFNIQVNNLTQFLPQDRVCEFAKMTPIQLLEETEKAVGDPELSQQHEKLITLNEELKQRQVTARQLESTLNKHQSNNAELEKDVERVQERNRLFARAEEMKKKLPWLIYDREKNTYQDAKEREKEAKRKLQQLLEQVATCKEPIQERKILKGKVESSCKKLRDALANLESKRRDLRRKENELRAQMNAKMTEIEDLNRSEANRVEKLRQARAMVVEAEQEFTNLPVVEPQTAESEELGKQISEIELAIQEKKRSLQECTLQERQKLSEIERCDRRITEIQSVTNQRLQLLKSSGLAPKIFEAYGWVQQNKNQFKQEVYGPVLLEVNIPNRELAGFVEGQVAGYIWKSFITQDREDRDLLVRNLKQFECPVINFTGEDLPPPGRPLTEEMKRLGIKGRLDEVIAAPQVVKDVLVGQFNLNLSYIGNAETNQRAEEARDLGIRDLWTPENHYRWQESRYTGRVSAFVNSVRPARLFSPRVDTTELEQIQRKRAEAERTAARFKEQKRTLSDEQRQLEDQEAVFQRQREEIVNRARFERRKRQEMQSKIEQRRRKLRSLEEEEDVQTAIQRLRAAVNDLNAKRCNKAIELKELLVKSTTDQMTCNVQSLVVAELDAIVKHMEKDVQVQERLALQAQQAHDDCKEEVQRCRRKLEEAKNYAESIARITPALSAAFQEMADTVEDLEDAIESCIAQAHTVLCQNPNVLEEYERRCQQIKDVSANLEMERKSLDFCTTEMERIQSTWLTTLRELVSRINTSFSRNFREMAVAGEVSLDEHGTEYDKYGINIKVKFRETGELQVLSAHHQSGGERSVSTILYLVSIQDLTHCPFRVVDEINQGMDPINERKMFQQLVRAASQPNTPQCFLLTPKLLPDLDYSDACSVLYIMNGPWIDSPSDLWKTGESWSQMSARFI